MTKNRVFTEAELEEMGKRTVDLICEAIDAGDKEKAKELSHRMYNEFGPIGDLYRNFLAGMLSYVYENYGDEALYKAMHQSCSAWFKPMAEVLEKEDFRHKVQMFAAALRGLLYPVKIEEDDEKACLTLPFCPTGGQIFKEGGYGPPKNFSIVQKPQALTWGRPNCPIYCAHDAMLGILSIEWFGFPILVVFPPEGFATGGCRFCIYKDPKDIPEEVYTQVGKKKPKG